MATKNDLAIARPDGLSADEGEVMDALIDAVEAWEQLPKQHDEDFRSRFFLENVSIPRAIPNFSPRFVLPLENRARDER
jgi:hypothetical protein